MNFFILLVGFGLVSGFPSDENGSSKRRRTESPKNVGKPTFPKPTTVTTISPSSPPSTSFHQSSANDCYFSKIRTSNLEQSERSHNAKVSTECNGNTMKWNSLVGTYKGRMYGAHNEMDLLATRGAAEYHDFEKQDILKEVGNRMVCTQHWKELVTDWINSRTIKHVQKLPVSNTQEFKCGMPSQISPHPSLTTPPAFHYFLLRDEAERLLNEYHVHVHVGTPLCQTHKEFVSVVQCVKLFENSITIDKPVSSRLQSAVAKYKDESEFCPQDAPMEVDEPEESDEDLPAFLTTDDSNFCHSKFVEWTRTLGIRRVEHRKQSSSLSRRSKRRKALAMNQILRSALELLAPGSSKELRDLMQDIDGNQWTTIRSKLFDDLMDSIVLEHSKLSTRKERNSLLSVVTFILPYSTILKYFPGISRYQYTSSRKYSLLLNRSPYVSTKRQKYVKENVVAFVDFITSPLVRSDLPYGRRVLKKSDGTKLEISDSLRNVRAIEIVEMYIKMKTENKEEEQLMSRSTLFKILDKCKATNREALECVDYFISDALESFETLTQVLNKMKTAGYIDGRTEKDYERRLGESKLYLQTDFKLHVKFESKISDHCIKFGLSDPKDKQHSASCMDGKSSHDHEKNMCERCQAIRDVFDDLRSIIKKLLDSASKKKLHKTSEDNVKSEAKLAVFLNDVEIAEKNVQELKKHLLRNKHSNHVRQELIDTLQVGDAILTLDWAQKVIPKQAIESQTDYFGKSGISVHVTNVLTIDKEGNLQQHNFVHITNHEVQDSITVILILEHILKELKHTSISRVHLRSDNAGCYHSNKTISSLPGLSKSSKVDIVSYTFSEPQGGKGSADRAANEFKTKLKTWLASGKNVETPEQLFVALIEGRVPKAMSSYLCTVDYSTIVEGSSDIEGIQNMYDFRFDSKHSKMTARKFAFIGSGNEYDTTKFDAAKGTLTIEKSGGYEKSDLNTFWKSSKCSKKCSLDDIEDQERSSEVVPFEENYVDVEEPIPKPMETAVFECPEEGCTATFTKYANLERHVSLGKHSFVPERETLLDFAMERYAENIEGIRESSVPNSLKDMLTELPPGTVLFSNPMGWAMPSKKHNKRYDKNVVQFVMKKFEEVATKQLKVYPKLIAKEIREQRKDGKLQFLPDTWLNYKQVSNLYHTFGRKSKEIEAKKALAKENKAHPKGDKTVTSLPTTVRTPQNRATAASADSKKQTSRSSSSGKEQKNRSKREFNDELIELVLEELNSKEFDDSEDIYDDNSEENKDFENLIAVVEKEKLEIFEN